MSTLGKAVILFGADTTTFRGDIGRAAAIFERGMGQMQRATLGFRSAIFGSITAGGMLLFTKSVIDQADEMGKLSQKVGIGTVRLSEYRMAARLGDLSNEQFKKGLIEFNKSLVEASNSGSRAGRIFGALGVDVRAGPAEAFRQFAEQFSKLPEGELRAAAATAILSKAGADWIPVLAAGAKGLDDAAQKAHALGDIVSEDFAKSAERFNDNMKLITRSATGAANAVLSGWAPVLADITGRLEKAAEKGSLLSGVLNELKILDAATGARMSPNDPLFQQRMDDLIRPPRQAVTGRIQGLPREARALDASLFPPVDPAKVRAALAETEALQKRQMQAIQQMEEKKKSLFNLNEQEILLERIKTGSYKDFDAATKVRLLNLALELDLRAELIQRLDLGLPAMQAEFDMLERGGDLYRDHVQAGQRNLEQLQFEIDLVGRSSREQEKMNAIRQIDLDLLEKKREAAHIYGEDQIRLMKEIQRLEDEAARQRGDAVRMIEERQEKERDWAVGAKRAFEDYVEEATNAAAQAHRLFTNAFRGMEDALVDFVKTGKLDFRSLADSIISDMIRIMIQRQIMGPILDGGGGDILGGIFGGIFGGGGGGMSSGEFGIGVAGFARGGIMSRAGPIPLRSYARGGVASSPQLAVFGEGSMNEAFVPLPDGRRIPVALEGGGGRAGDSYFIDARGADPAGIARLEAQIRALNGSIEHRAVNAAANAKGRGGATRHRMRSG